MTTDPFIEAAHTEAKRVWPGGVTRAHDMALKEARGGFIAGARWARTHLAAQEPTDAEIEAAKAVLDSVEYADEPQSIRAALSAARAIRRDEENR